MNRRTRKKLQKAFLKEVGPNAATFKAMMDVLPNVAFYMKDMQGRIMALNRRNCEICNIHDETDAIGRQSDEIFPRRLAQSYIELDHAVRKTGRPILNSEEPFAADLSNDVHVKSVFPLFDCQGRLVGTTCLYYRRPDVSGAPDWHGILRPVTEFIAEHFAEEITLQQLADMVALPPSTFRHQFTNLFGVSPGRYITAIRLNAARELLERTEKLVSDIAAETGFWDQSHLTKLFKQARGITPGAYRRRFRDSSPDAAK